MRTAYLLTWKHSIYVLSTSSSLQETRSELSLWSNPLSPLSTALLWKTQFICLSGVKLYLGKNAKKKDLNNFSSWRNKTAWEMSLFGGVDFFVAQESREMSDTGFPCHSLLWCVYFSSSGCTVPHSLTSVVGIPGASWLIPTQQFATRSPHFGPFKAAYSWPDVMPITLEKGQDLSKYQLRA